ncbi:MAG: proline--tRNA ligase [Bifidobacteriaceae bacterium]|jgi:prolyl-tRNA synthetase|nr:proline--tRNA ligase [Bifidobacteriaceae bacterium]
MSNLFVKTLREDPVEAEVASHKLLVRAGYIRRQAPGIYAWLPLGLRVLAKVEAVVRDEMNRIGGQEVRFPALLPAEPYQASGRWTDYGPNMFRLRDRRQTDMVLAPTHEEVFTLLVKDMCSSYKDLPLVIYQIQTKYRDEARPRAGLLRGREFIMKDAYSFDLDESGLDRAYDDQRRAYQRIFDRLGLDVVIVSAMSGAMGGSRSEEFLYPTPIGEDTYVRSAGGYAANVEAVSTVAPPGRPIDGLPPARVEPTPNTTTIDSLVDAANRDQPRADGQAWTAADTLKNVVVAVTRPGGGRELAVVGVPGDREVDMTRLAAALFPSEVEPAADEDFARHPELVRGYIGPQILGVNAVASADAVAPVSAGSVASGDAVAPVSPGSVASGDAVAPVSAGSVASADAVAPVSADPADRAAADDSAAEAGPAGAVPYFLDPRVVAGTVWITGANRAGHHVFGLVAGRDFAAAGQPGQPIVDAAEVRAGDLAPDGSGPLEMARGIELGHIFQLGRKYAEALDLKVLDRNGKRTTVVMGSYGVGVTRSVAAVAEKFHDDRGLIWPAHLAPAHVHVVATGKDPGVFTAAAALADALEESGLEVLYDDRLRESAGVKFADAELLGVPYILVVGRGLASGLVEFRDRASGAITDLPLHDAAAQVAKTVDAALARGAAAG